MDTARLLERNLQLAQAIERLCAALAQPETEFVRDSVVQRFEFAYELAWKAAKLWLEGKDIDVRNAKDTLREALQQGLIEDGARWSELHRYRNLTSHTYSETLAREVAGFVKKEAVALLKALYEKLKTPP